MKLEGFRRFQGFLVLLVLSAGVLAQGVKPVRVLIETEAGEIEVEIDTVRAPITGANFLKYVDAGLFDGGRFFRTVRPDNQVDKPVKIAVIQAAGSREKRAQFFPAIPLERTNATGLTHKDGTLSMARSTPDTARDSFSIVVGDQPSMDFGGARQPDGQGFAAFGQVVRGMDVVRRIQMGTAEGETLTPAVGIVSVKRVVKP
jgi:peptidyl-prolyl cis-trans isomerase A (cyclophilin A)